MKCCTCSKLAHLNFSLLCFSRFQNSEPLSLLELFSFLYHCIFLEVSHVSTLVSFSLDSSNLYASTINLVHVVPLKVLCSCPTLVFQTSNPPPSHFLSHFSAPTLPAYFWRFFLYLKHPLLPITRLGVLQWNAAGLRVRSAELLQFNSTQSVGLICILESKP